MDFKSFWCIISHICTKGVILKIEKDIFPQSRKADETTRETIAPPFFQALLNYIENGAASWHCPGHSAGAAFLKSPVGKVFHNFFGHNMLQADVCNAVEELGQLLEHTGPIAASEKNAARIFNADNLFFVTNGTSTANKIVWHSTVGPDDIVIVDRNCHKSNLHAIMMTGAIPVYLAPTRNHYGIIGPIPASEFSYENIQKKITNHPFIKDKTKKPRIMTLTQCTYDGISYNVEAIKAELDGKVDSLHFDEAWLPHAHFHEFYKDMHAMGAGRPRPTDSLIFSTQSTHKMLAGLSQASQILVQDSENKKLNRFVFNEAYMMHTTTSPQYSIIASCDVTAAMMDGPNGRALVEESLVEAIDFRRAMQPLQDKIGFKVWGPDNLPSEGVGPRENWILKPNEKWHGFGEVSENFNIMDPLKTTILTSGLDVDGNFADQGVPASIVAKYLVENGIIVEKCGLYSFFVMFTIGTTKGKWKTIVDKLSQFKADYDKNKALTKAMPKFAAAHPGYQKLGLKDLCQQIHDEYKANDMARMTTDIYISEITPAMKPSDAFAKIAHEEIDRIEIDDLEGKVTAVLLTPYPPGIPLLVPGERFNKTIVDYLKFARDFNSMFPGFETDVHGLATENVNGVKKYFVDCVREKA
ncbi:aminotransferase class I/II-fold pyridoxal phosphate-dependent enzyme [bacterium]|nr:aminotransferase class I/II-fold pyridoxal phosphate-dependent enzyme [bacterium]